LVTPAAGRHDRALACALWTLSALFLARVVGQIIVTTFDVRWLPPMADWQSGLLPYPALLASQAVILLVMLWINVSVSRRRGFFARPHPRLGWVLLIVAVVYAGAMVVRYVISGQLHPDRRLWPPGSIPIAFHFVLAGYLYVLSRLAGGGVRARRPISSTAPPHSD
jgi:hypothetical protein